MRAMSLVKHTPGELSRTFSSQVAARPHLLRSYVTLSLHGDRRGGRKTGRAVVARSAQALDAANPPLLHVSFPVRGLRVSARSEKLYADLGYLDTVNAPDIMPGGFEAMGLEGDDVELLTTFGAADIRLYDQNGLELMTDPANRERDITIQVAIPPEAWATLEDEDPTTAVVDVPYYYYDEDAGIWKIHTDADGNPQHGVLVDNFGNELNAEDLIELQQVAIDADGNVVSLAYSPGGAGPDQIVIYSRGSVNHFTSWNCDQGGRSRSFNYKLTDEQKREMKGLWLRMVKLLGGTSFDSTQSGRAGGDRGNTHAGGPRTNIAAAGFVQDLLSRDASTQQAFLNNIPIMGDKLLQAYMDALPGAIDNVAMDSDRWKGFGVVLKSSEAIALMEQARSAGIPFSCEDNRQACIKALQGVADIIKNHGNAEDAAKLLTNIAVEYYDPSKLPDVKNAMVNGVKILNAMAKVTGGNNSMLASVSGKMLKVQEWVDKLQGLDPRSTEYSTLLQNLATTVKDVKAEAASMGARMALRKAGRHAEAAALGRVYEPGAVAVPATEEEVAALEKELEYDWEDIGGLLFNGNPMNRYKWGEYDSTGAFTETAAPANAAGGSEVAQLQYWDGAQWQVVSSRSDFGVEAAFIPVPSARSYRDGTADAPAVNLGTFELALDASEPTVFQGTITVGGQPTQGLEGRFVRLRSGTAGIGADGTFSGQLPVNEAPVVSGENYQTYLTFSWGSGHWATYTPANRVMDFGTIDLPDAIMMPANWTTSINQAIGTAAQIDAATSSLSGALDLTYELKLYDSWQARYNGELPLYSAVSSTGSFTLPALDEYGYYAVEVAVKSGATSINLTTSIAVRNSPPQVGSFSIAPAIPVVGDTVTVTVPVTDPDDDDIERVAMSATCQPPQGWSFSLQGRYEKDDQGNYSGIFETDKSNLLRVLEGDIACTVNVQAWDSTGRRGQASHDFTLTPTNLPPVVESNRFPEQMDSPYRVEVSPTQYVRFGDPNGDIVDYTLDCGNGSDPVTSERPIGGWRSADNCVYETPGSYTLSYTATDSAGQAAPVQTTVVIWAPLGLGVDLSGLTVNTLPSTLPNGEAAWSDWVALPAGADRSFPLALTANSPNGAITSFQYEVYRDGWRRVDSGSLADADSATARVTIDRPGYYRVYVSAQDDKEVWASVTESFQVVAPFDVHLTVEGEASPAAWYLSSDTLDFAATVADPPAGFAGRYQWSVKGPEDADFQVLGSAETFSRQLPAGQHAVRCEVTNTADAGSGSVVKDLALTIYDPVAAALGTDYTYPEPAEGAVALGDRYTLTASAPLPAGVTVASVQWLVTSQTPGARFTSLQTANPGIRELVFHTEGTYDIRAQLTDSRGLTSVVVQTVTVKAYPPVIDSLTVDKTSGAPPLAVTATAAAHDPDGQVVNYLWKVTGTPVSGLAISRTFLKTAADGSPETLSYTFAAEGTYTISLVVEDNSNRKSAQASAAIGVAYLPPVIDSLTASPASGPAPLSVTFTASASDSDGTIVSYAWDVGADGTVEQTGAAATFQHTFSTFGSHPVQLTVTDSQGKTATKTISVYAYDPDAGITFQFKEMRSNGLGPAMDFTAGADEPYQHEMGGQWTAPGLPEVLDPSALTVVDLASTMNGVTGFNGFYQAGEYGLSLYLAQVGGTGAYQVGLSPMGYGNDPVSLTYPAGYGCGLGLNAYGAPSADPIQIYPGSQDTDTADNVHAAAVVGTWDGAACTLTGYAYGSGTGASIALGTVNGRAVPAVAGYSLDQVSFDGPLDVAIFSSGLDKLLKDAEDRYLLPVIPNSAVTLVFKTTDTSITQTLTIRVPAADLAGSGALTIAVPSVTTETLALTNLPGDGTVVVTSVQGNAELTSRIGVQAGTISVNAGRLTAATENRLEYRGTYDHLPRASGLVDLSSGIDVAALGSTATVSDLTLNVDTTAKTATVSFSSAADACLVELQMGYDWGSAERWADMGMHLITDGRAGSHTVSTVYPATEVFSWTTSQMETVPGTDQVTSVRATVICLDTKQDYDASLRSILAGLGWANWYFETFKGVTDAYHQPPAATWTAGP